MKKQRIKKGGYICEEPIFNIAAYNCSRAYTIGRKNSKRALAQVLAITNYMHNLPETPKEQMNNM